MSVSKNHIRELKQTDLDTDHSSLLTVTFVGYFCSAISALQKQMKENDEVMKIKRISKAYNFNIYCILLDFVILNAHCNN